MTEQYVKFCQKGMLFGIVGFPTQDELVDLIKKLPKYEKITDLNLLSAMRIGISKMYCNMFLSDLSINEMWMIFYMKEGFNKVWLNGGWK